MRWQNVPGIVRPFPGVLALQHVPAAAVVGNEAVHCFDSFGEPDATASFEFDGPGSSDGSVWRWTPTAADEGWRLVTFRARIAGKVVGRVPHRIRVLPATHASPPAVRVVLAGDSITAADAVDSWTNRFFRYLTAAGIPWTSLGSFAATNADPGVRHQAISGRTWRWFAGLDDQGTYQTPWETASDVASYIATTCGGTPPTHVHFQLGPNDANAFGGAPEDRDAYYDTVAAASVGQIKLWRDLGVTVTVGGCLGPNSRDAAFGTPGTTERQAYRVKRAALIRRTFAAWKAAGAKILATHACVDTVGGFDAFNNVHPEVTIGHAQIARAVYAGIRGTL